MVLAAAWLFPDLETVARLAVSFGVSISFALSLAGFFLMVRSPRAEPGQFVKLLLGGMAARLVGALAAVAIGLGLFDLPAGAFVGSCLTSYVVFMGLEHFYLLPIVGPQRNGNARNGNT